jgi:L-seryl-tRNA(Ser) seleniumtransferase
MPLGRQGAAVESDKNKILKNLPAMDELLSEPWVLFYEEQLGREMVKNVFSSILAETRKAVLHDEAVETSIDGINQRAIAVLKGRVALSLQPIVNATGVVVHTNLGRSCLPIEAVEAVCQVAARYNTLEFDLKEGKRGQRNAHVEWLLCQFTGAEAAVVVNNNAGAVLLCLAALAREKEVIVSRGELVEIGGSFRIPDIMAFSGARLVEVGATNRTHLKDYGQAFTDETSMVLKVHPSNFRIEGFTSSVPREELSHLAQEKNVIFMEDLGSGVLIDLSPWGLCGEPTVKDCIMAGVDLVTFSGDKMLGGPQIGAVVGKKSLIDRLRTYPLLRALRVDKMTLAAFEKVLRMYLQGRWNEIPTLSMLTLKVEDLRKKAQALRRKIKKTFPHLEPAVVEVNDAVGGGAFPVTRLKGYGVALKIQHIGSAGTLQTLLRQAEMPIVAGASEDSLIFHVRTLMDKDDERILQGLAWLLEVKKGE